MTTTVDPLRWYTLQETADLCRRAPRTIANLISKHQLPVRRAWEVRRRLRKRIVLIAPPIVVKLQAMTLFLPPKSQRETMTRRAKKGALTSHHDRARLEPSDPLEG